MFDTMTVCGVMGAAMLEVEGVARAAVPAGSLEN